MNVALPPTYEVKKTAEAMAWVLAVALLLDALLTQQRSSNATGPGEQPDRAVLTDLDLDALADGEQRRVRTYGGDTLRLEAEHVKEGDNEE
ncbi:hypothetical protein IL252_13700 [Halomicrobium sp. IBSBa]|uniref:hypothetical protein n=1 Tax=Halomicrobium sp. IBSBa TaxID=2778916 RepID=UPI001ABF88BD|nr:hypothetical protein [Halomicrobium sp. IBSBa]MBO4248874.1 hypothetical protein [Halomicrobium sp. IBSBa]